MKHIVVALLSIRLLSLSAQPATVSATQTGRRIDVTIDGRYFTAYQFPENEKYPYLYPVNGPLSGGSVTSIRNGDYPHHSSVFLACDRVNGGNYWQEGLERGRIVSIGARITQAAGPYVVIEDECIWKRPDAPSPIIDRRKITISAPDKQLYRIDFDIELEMLTDVSILKTNHSLFSVRLDPDLAVKQGGVMINAEHKEGEKATFGLASPWIDCYGTRKSGPEGILVMQHPSNTGYPSPWFTRDYGFISPTAMFRPEDDRETQFKKGDIVQLRYRILVHAGEVNRVNPAAEFEKYKSE